MGKPIASDIAPLCARWARTPCLRQAWHQRQDWAGYHASTRHALDAAAARGRETGRRARTAHTHTSTRRQMHDGNHWNLSLLRHELLRVCLFLLERVVLVLDTVKDGDTLLQVRVPDQLDVLLRELGIIALEQRESVTEGLLLSLNRFQRLPVPQGLCRRLYLATTSVPLHTNGPTTVPPCTRTTHSPPAPMSAATAAPPRLRRAPSCSTRALPGVSPCVQERQHPPAHHRRPRLPWP